MTCEANGVPNTDALPSLTDVSHLRSLPNGIVSLLASHRIHLASMSTAQVSSPIIASRGSRARFIGAATMSKSRACRQLFPTSEEERQEQERIPDSVQEALETTQDNQSRRWNFDFKRGIPKPGSPWEAVAEEQVPPPNSSRIGNGIGRPSSAEAVPRARACAKMMVRARFRCECCFERSCPKKLKTV